MRKKNTKLIKKVKARLQRMSKDAIDRLKYLNENYD